MKKSKIINIINEEIRKTITESMDYGIADAPHSEQLDNLLQITDFLSYQIASNILQNNKNVSLFNIITPDGGDEFKETGTINFYTKNYPKELISKTLSFIKYILNEKDIKMGEPRVDRKGQPSEVIRIPIIENDSAENDNPQINMSNANARKIFVDVLNFDSGDIPGTFDAVDVMMKLQSAKGNVGKYPEKSSMQQKSGSSNVYGNIMGQDYIKEKLKQIEEITQWAIDNGYRRMQLG